MVFNIRTRIAPSLFLLLLLVLCPALPAVGQQNPTATGDPPPVQPSGKQVAEQEDERPQAGQVPVKPTPDLSSPRATLRTFLVAMQAALADKPERIDDAVACLDTSQLDGDDAVDRARSLAGRLYTVIDAIGIKLEDVPAAAKPGSDEATEFVLHRAQPGEGENQPARVVALEYDFDDEAWRFTSETLDSIPALEKKSEEAVKPTEPDAPDVPASRRSPRATMDTFIKAMKAKPPDYAGALLCLNPTGRDTATWTVVGRDLATTLKTVMDKTAQVLLIDIPDVGTGPPYVWRTLGTGNITIDRVTVEKPKEGDKVDNPFGLVEGEWRFAVQTLDTIDAQYKEVINKEVVSALKAEGVVELFTVRQRIERALPAWMQSELWSLKAWQWVALILLLPLGWVLHAIAAFILGTLIAAWLGRMRVEIDRDTLRRVARSIAAVVVVFFWYHAIRVLGLPEPVFNFLFRATRLALGVTAVWVAYRCVDIIGGQIMADKDVSLTRFDDVLIPLLRKILRIAIVLVGFLAITDWMDWNIKTVIGALGVGGVAIAFAAQDTISNFFGSITVLFDRPFGIGDWIVIGDVEGTVEHVGFRSTRVRTFYNSMVTMPNSKMVNTQVDNYGARRYRRARVMLSLTYSTPPEKIDAFCEGVRELVRLHPYTRKDYYHVYFNQFSASSLDVLLYVFFEVPDWGTELRERHRLFVDILRLAERLGVEFAFPTQTVWLEQASKDGTGAAAAPIKVGEGDPDHVGLQTAARVFEEAYGAVPVRPDPVVIDRAPRSKRKDAP